MSREIDGVEFWTITETVQKSGFSRSTVYRLIRQKEIKQQLVVGQNMVIADSVRQWMAKIAEAARQAI